MFLAFRHFRMRAESENASVSLLTADGGRGSDHDSLGGSFLRYFCGVNGEAFVVGNIRVIPSFFTQVATLSASASAVVHDDIDVSQLALDNSCGLDSRYLKGLFLLLERLDKLPVTLADAFSFEDGDADEIVIGA